MPSRKQNTKQGLKCWCYIVEHKTSKMRVKENGESRKHVKAWNTLLYRSLLHNKPWKNIQLKWLACSFCISDFLQKKGETSQSSPPKGATKRNYHAALSIFYFLVVANLPVLHDLAPQQLFRKADAMLWVWNCSQDTSVWHMVHAGHVAWGLAWIPAILGRLLQAVAAPWSRRQAEPWERSQGR